MRIYLPGVLFGHVENFEIGRHGDNIHMGSTLLLFERSDKALPCVHPSVASKNSDLHLCYSQYEFV
jgi:hypothetical protein